MHTLYNIVSGPLAWLAFIVFIGGSIYKILSMANMAKQKDSVIYEYWSASHAIRSIFHWIVPFASTNWRNNPIMTLVTFLFHISLIFVPVFLSAHVILWKEAFDISWWYLPDSVADIMTVIVILSCVFFLVRRQMRPDVKYLTSFSDYIILLIVAAPFITGFMAYHQFPGYNFIMILHIFSGEIMLAAIPFTRLSHMLFFVFTRGYMGSEFGAVRHANDW